MKFPSKKRRQPIHTPMRGGFLGNRMKCVCGGGGSERFVLVRHGAETPVISVAKKSPANSYAYEGEGGSWEIV